MITSLGFFFATKNSKRSHVVISERIHKRLCNYVRPPEIADAAKSRRPLLFQVQAYSETGHQVPTRKPNEEFLPHVEPQRHKHCNKVFLAISIIVLVWSPRMCLFGVTPALQQLLPIELVVVWTREQIRRLFACQVGLLSDQRVSLAVREPRCQRRRPLQKTFIGAWNLSTATVLAEHTLDRRESAFQILRRELTEQLLTLRELSWKSYGFSEGYGNPEIYVITVRRLTSRFRALIVVHCISEINSFHPIYGMPTTKLLVFETIALKSAFLYK